ncbi:MAG: EAL domain-containing protein [Lachnospiraceae bacterium]|nr:EAL domain-containing protein [Lachnospiraceae bacterium]
MNNPISAMPDPEVLRGYVETHIDEAIEQDAIKVFYQPVARTLTGEICGMEALARWDDPVYGLLAPDLFIPTLEASRQIHKLDSCIIRKIGKEYAAHLHKDRRNVTISFNLSRLDFQLCDIQQVIEDTIHENKLPRDAFRVEITESMMENNEERMHDVIDQFWNRGLRVWMDDFGSGYSSLNVLKDYRFDTLKIDMVFLRRFDLRSKEIIKSIVDMAKRIGIHTLAEGVETEEQLAFLKSIGCEKAQGYYIGKPQPYEECLAHLKEKGFQLEAEVKRQYYHEIGKINVLSADPFLSVHKGDTGHMGKEGQIPIAFVEHTQGRIHFLFANESYLATLRSIGVESTEQVEKDFSYGETPFGEKFLALMQKARISNEVETVNFVRAKNHCFAKVRSIADYPGGNAFLCILQNLSANSQLVKDSLLADCSVSLFSLYDHIEQVDLNTGFSDTVYQNTMTQETYNRLPAAQELKIYASEEIYPADQERYLAFTDLSNIEERLNKSATGFLSTPCRVRMSDGSYAWKLYLALYSGDKRDRKILVCSRRMETGVLSFLNTDAISEAKAFQSDLAKSNQIDGETLWGNLLMNADFAFFWKDKNRRFLGANKTFLSYYGMSDVKELIGKTDEDVGWHVNPLPYKEDEEKVLKEGIQTHMIPGHCIRKGEIRDIVASKMPIYKDGKIIGLMGYFQDVTDQKYETQELALLSMTDSLTGLLNFLGIINAALRFQEAYVLTGEDFSMTFLDIEGFREFNRSFGMEWGNSLLKSFAEALQKAVGTNHVIARYSSDHFLVLSKCAKTEDAEKQLLKLQEAVADIHEVHGTPCTIYAKMGYSLYSDVKDLQEMFRIAEEKANS